MSSSRLRVEPNRVTLDVAFHISDLACAVPVDNNRDGVLDAGELQEGRAALLGFIRSRTAVTVDDQVLAVEHADVSAEEEGGVAYRLVFAGALGSRVEVALDVFDGLPRGHRQLAAVLGPGGETVAESLLHAGSRRLTAAFDGSSPAGWFAQAARFFVLGVEHILIGYDHILFLLALLLVARRLGSVLAIITSFTVAHSVTLALASLDLVRVPSSWVEPVIALSIVWVALANLRARPPQHRWRITFAFGLIHGFGFASVLRDLGFAEASGVAVPLLSFNAGVEVGQLAIAAVAVPLLWLLQRRATWRRRSTLVLSGGVAALGAWWLLERTLLGV